MTAQGRESSGAEQVSEAVTTAIHVGTFAAKLAYEALRSTADNMTSTTTAVGEIVGPVALQLVEQGTETVGRIVTPIAENPLVKSAAKFPGINWLLDISKIVTFYGKRILEIFFTQKYEQHTESY